MRHFIMFTLYIAAIANIVLYPTVSEASEESVDKEAVAHFSNGIEFYKQHQFEKAAIEFARAYELKPSYKILFNIAQAENMLEHYARALNAYENYLSQGGEEIAEDRLAMVKEEINRISKQVGYIEINSQQKGALVLIDGEESGKTPLDSPVIVDVGKREVEIVIDNSSVFKRIYRVASGQLIKIDLNSPAHQADDTAASKTDEQKTEDPGLKAETKTKQKRNLRPTKVAGAILLGTGAAAALTAVATGVIATSKKNNIVDDCTGYVCSASKWEDESVTVKNLSLTTDILIGVASAAAVTGIVLLIVKPKPKERPISGFITPVNFGEGILIGGTGRF